MRFATLLFTFMLTASAEIPDLAQLNRMAARFAKTKIQADTSSLDEGDRKALPKLVEAARVLNWIYMDQLWSGNRALYQTLQKDSSPLGKARLHYYWLNKGPWSSLDDHAAFVPAVAAKKPAGANFYPEDMTREEFEKWVSGLSEAERVRAQGFFSVVRRDPQSKALRLVPYSEAYKADLQRCAALLREAAALTTNASLKRFLELRAAAFFSDDYYASDVAWMDLDAPIDVTIGPYETYTDELFGYKAAFEAYVNIRDDAETDKVKFFSDHLQEIENNLPLDPKYRNPKLGASAPIRVVNEVIATGDAAHGVQTAAYNLPNDERVILEKGSKRVMLKNVQEAKFESILRPIASRVLPQEDQRNLSFDSFFTHILAHELSHGIGPHALEIGGRKTSVRQELKDLYSAIEEAKADITALFMLQYMFDRGQLPRDETRLYTTFLASSFRTLRFGIKEAHGRGMALQLNYMLDKGAVATRQDGTFTVSAAKMKAAVVDLTRDLLTIEATGDYEGARRMLDTLVVIRPEVQKALDRLSDIPTDIEPVFATVR
jgi:hypothetical protein